MNAAAGFAQAVSSLQQGHAAQAARLCTEVLGVDPRHAGALHLLGIVAAGRGAAEDAAGYFRRSLHIAPGDPAVMCNLGNALRDLRQPSEALVSYRAALAIVPDFAGALYGAGNALLDQGQIAESIRYFEQACAAQPGFADAWNNRGNALLACGRTEEALASYLQALTIDAAFQSALANCARTLVRLRRVDEALRCNDRRIALHPQDAAAYRDRGFCLLQLQRTGEALESYSAALALQPDDAESLYGRGTAAQRLGHHERALADFERAMEFQPDSIDIQFRRAEALRDLHRLGAAADAFERILDRDPRREYALGNLIQSRLQLCDWRDYAANVERAIRAVERGERVCLPGAFQVIAASPGAQLACARSYWAAGPAARSARPRAPRTRVDGKIRVAYLSADFREHPVAMQLVGVLERHDRKRFDIHGLSFSTPQDSPIGRRIGAAFDHFVDVSRMSDAAVAALVEQHDIDIAVDLMGFSARGRPSLFALRPAPLQIGFMGYCGTMGSTHYDYLIADETVLPRDEQQHYSEQVVYLPGCYLPCDDRRAVAPGTPSRAECGLPENGFVFCCFNTHYKFAPGMFDIWMDLLRSVPGSVLWLAEASPELVANLRREAALRSVGAERLVFAPRVADAAEHLARYRNADLFLDTRPFGAHATACDALWSQLPVLTVRGATFAGRVASSLLLALELPELVTSNVDEYRQVALQLAANPGRLRSLRARLAKSGGQHKPFDTADYTRNLQASYTRMHERAQRGEPPRSFRVADDRS